MEYIYAALSVFFFIEAIYGHDSKTVVTLGIASSMFAVLAGLKFMG